MSISARFSIIVSTLLLILFILLAWTSYLHDKDMVQQENVSTARIIAKNLIITRDYLSAEAKTDILEKSFNLTPQVAATKIAQRLTAGSGYYVRQVSLRFRNPSNRPDHFEQEQLIKFSSGLSKESSQVTGENGSEVLRYMLPMIASESCLVCHGKIGRAHV